MHDEGFMTRTPNENKVILASGLSHMFSHYIMLVFPALALSLAREFDVDLSEVLAVSFPSYLIYGLGAIPAGLLTDKFGARRVLLFCLIGCCLGAFWASRAESLKELMFALGLIGAASSLYHPAGMAFISRNVRKAGSALGTNGIYGNFGIALAPFATGALAAWYGWRSAYLWSGVALMAVTFLVVFVQPEDKLPEAAPEAKPEGRFHFGWPVLALMALAVSCAGLGYRSVSLTLPAFFEERVTFLSPFFQRLDDNLSLTSSKTVAATFLTSFAYLIGMAGQRFGGIIADSKDLRLGYISFHALSIPFVLALFLLPDGLLAFAVAGYIFFSMGMQPLENSIVAKLAPARHRGFVYGLKFTLTFGIGSLAVYVVAALRHHTELASVFFFTALCALGTVLFAGLFFTNTQAQSAMFLKDGMPESSPEENSSEPQLTV